MSRSRATQSELVAGAMRAARHARGRLLVLLLVGGLASCKSIMPPPLEYETAKSQLDTAVAVSEAAAEPAEVSDALLPPISVEMPQVDGRPIEPRFDLQVSKAPANQVFLAIAAGTRYSMVVHPDVKEPISIDLKDVTVIEALETIREVYGYEYGIRGTRIMIKPIGLQTRVFQVNYLVSTRKGETEVRISSGAISDTSTPGTQGRHNGTVLAGHDDKPAIEEQPGNDIAGQRSLG